jgi:hypothetical protein
VRGAPELSAGAHATRPFAFADRDPLDLDAGQLDRERQRDRRGHSAGFVARSARRDAQRSDRDGVERELAAREPAPARRDLDALGDDARFAHAHDDPLRSQRPEQRPARALDRDAPAAQRFHARGNERGRAFGAREPNARASERSER